MLFHLAQANVPSEFNQLCIYEYVDAISCGSMFEIVSWQSDFGYIVPKKEYSGILVFLCNVDSDRLNYTIAQYTGE